jgi:hypothetical protein
MAVVMRRWVALGLVTVIGLGMSLAAWAQATSGVLRVALLPQWTIQQHRGVGGGQSPALREAVEGGVVDRTVFAWQRGLVQRQALVTKPFRVLPESEAGPLGGRGRFDLAAVRPPAGRAAWTEVEVTRTTPGADDVLVLEIGGERNTMTQVLETLLVTEPGRGLVEVPLARSALVPGLGVPVVTAPFEQPLPPALAQRFREEAGMGLLVVRSRLWDVRNGDVTASGPADTVPLGSGDWREGDRVFIRISAAALDRQASALVLGWKDRTLKPDPDIEFPRRSALPFPLIR